MSKRRALNQLTKEDYEREESEGEGEHVFELFYLLFIWLLRVHL